MDEALLEELGATAEVMGIVLSSPALSMMCDDLANYPAEKIRQALKRLRQESARFTVAEIIKRLPGMWPGPEIAWSTAPKDEALSFVTTREALTAWDVASHQESISGRMAFKECYEQLVSAAKLRGESPDWIVSLGHDKSLRAQVVLDAVIDGRLLPHKASVFLPHMPVEDIEQLARGTITSHALLELHQPTINSLEQLVEPHPRDTPIASVESSQSHLVEIIGILNKGPAAKPVVSDDSGEDLTLHKQQVQAELRSLKKLHATRA